MNRRYSLVLFFCLTILLVIFVIKRQQCNVNRFSESRAGDISATLSLQREFFMCAQDVTF